MNRKKSNRVATAAVRECRAIIDRAAADSSGNRGLMVSMILDTLTAELLANGRTNDLAHIPETAVLGGAVEIIINHGPKVMDEPVIMHALTVLYMLGEEEKCKEIHKALLEALRFYTSTHEGWSAEESVH